MNKDTKEFKCDECDKTFGAAIALSGHKRSHKSPKELPAIETITWEKPDSLKLFNQTPGIRYRFCGETTIQKRGWRNWEPVDPKTDSVRTSNHGHSLGPSKDAHIRVGDTILTFMPEERARARERHHFARNNPKQASIDAREKLEARLAGKRVGLTTDIRLQDPVAFQPEQEKE